MNPTSFLIYSNMKQFFCLSALLILTMACNPSKTPEKAENKMTYFFLVGTYTDSTSQGINELTFIPSENKLEVNLIAPGVHNPSFVVANSKGNLVFSLEEDMSITGGNVMVFSRSEPGQTLAPIDTIPSYGDHPCYVALSPTEDFLAVANYTGGSLSIFRVNSESKLDYLQTIQHQGKSVNQARQEKPHVHSTVFSPDGKYLLAADLGTDKIYVYSFEPAQSAPLTLFKEYAVTPGDGPRHLVFSPDGDEILVVQEMTAVLEVLSFDNGEISPKQRLSLLSDGFTGSVGAAEVRNSPDGKNTYVSNRGDANTISVFGKKSNGEYERIQQIPSGGLMPRNFNLTADGKYLLAAHQASNDIVVFERDTDTGKLTQTEWKVSVNKPVYLFRLPN